MTGRSGWILAGLMVLATLLPGGFRANAAEARYTMQVGAQLTLDGAGDLECPGVHGLVSAINQAGTVVGAYASSEKRLAPYAYANNERKRLKGGDGGGIALSVNNAGTIGGALFLLTRGDKCQFPGNRQPALWQGDSPSQLSLPADGVGGLVWDLDDAGVAVGTADMLDGTLAPVTWSNGTVQTLVMPALPNGEATGGEAYAINDLGAVVGMVERYDLTSPLQTQAVEWVDGIAQMLPNLGSWSENRAWSINDAGEIVGYSCPDDDSSHQAVVWQNGQITALDLPDGVTESEARDVNNAGVIVGNGLIGDRRSALVWIDGHVHQLDEVVDELGDYHLLRADAINEGGVIAAVAVDSSGYRFIVILTPD